MDSTATSDTAGLLDQLQPLLTDQSNILSNVGQQIAAGVAGLIDAQKTAVAKTTGKCCKKIELYLQQQDAILQQLLNQIYSQLQVLIGEQQTILQQLQQTAGLVFSGPPPPGGLRPGTPPRPGPPPNFPPALQPVRPVQPSPIPDFPPDGGGGPPATPVIPGQPVGPPPVFPPYGPPRPTFPPLSPPQPPQPAPIVVLPAPVNLTCPPPVINLTCPACGAAVQVEQQQQQRQEVIVEEGGGGPAGGEAPPEQPGPTERNLCDVPPDEFLAQPRAVMLIPFGQQRGRDSSADSECGQLMINDDNDKVFTVGQIIDAGKTDDPLGTLVDMSWMSLTLDTE